MEGALIHYCVVVLVAAVIITLADSYNDYVIRNMSDEELDRHIKDAEDFGESGMAFLHERDRRNNKEE